MRRKLWVLLAALLLVVAIGDTLVWHFAVQRMREGLAAWVAARRADGWSVRLAVSGAGGWPRAATLALRDVALEGGERTVPRGVAWHAQRVVLRLDVRHPHELRIAAIGTQQLRVAAAPAIAYDARRFVLAVPLQADALGQAFHLRAAALHAGAPAGNRGMSLIIDRLDLDGAVNPGARRDEAALSLALTTSNIDLPQQVKWALGSHIAAFVLDAALDGPLPAAPSPAATAAAWRDAGGSLNVERVAIDWGPLDLTAHGTLKLDAQLQPTATATAEVTGYAATLDALARDGVMSRSAAITATAVLSLLATTPANGGAPAVEVPLSLRNGTLSMHQVPLLRLPKLDWPQQ